VSAQVAGGRKYRAKGVLHSAVCTVCGTAWQGYRPTGDLLTCGSLSCRSQAGWRRFRGRKQDVVAARQCAWCGEHWEGAGLDSPHGLVCSSGCLRGVLE